MLLTLTPGAAGPFETIEIGILNNLAQRARAASERQLAGLLQSAILSHSIRLSFYSFDDSDVAIDGLQYRDVEALKASRLDGLIVTGCEPKTARIQQETFWPLLREVIDWAEGNTIAAIWSCFAAHAAIFHMDGVRRRALPVKCSGMFEVRTCRAHDLTLELPPRYWMPHSRWNTVDACDLAEAGYEILSTADNAGPDLFVKAWRSLFVFLHGHPEYEALSLANEYRRDVRRFLRGQTLTYPTLPTSYFTDLEAKRLRLLQAAAKRNDGSVTDADFLIRASALRPYSKHATIASCFFKNWLHFIGDRKHHLHARCQQTSRKVA